MSNVGGRRGKVNPLYGVDGLQAGVSDCGRCPPVSQGEALN